MAVESSELFWKFNEIRRLWSRHHTHSMIWTVEGRGRHLRCWISYVSHYFDKISYKTSFKGGRTDLGLQREGTIHHWRKQGTE